MSDALRRALRTFLWAFLGSIITNGVLSTIQTEGIVDWSVLRKAAVSAAAAGVIALLTWIVNALEDNGVVPALLKAPPSPGANPVPNDAGAVSPLGIVVVILVLLVLLYLAGFVRL